MYKSGTSLLLILLFPLLLFSQPSWPVKVAVSNESAAIPYTRFFTTPVHPCVQVGTEYLYQSGAHHEFYQTANLGYIYHNHLYQGLYLNTGIGYDYKFSFGLKLKGLFELGYLHTIVTQDEYQFNEGEFAKGTDWGNARGEKAYFEPGEDVIYSNTNYILLGMIITAIEGKPFYEVFEEKIFNPLNLTFTRFAATDPVPAGIIRGYVDFYNNLDVINATYYSGWDYYTADGGLICNAYDLNIFLTSLFKGEIISESSLDEMLTWQKPKETDPEFFPLWYGLGIFKMETPWGDAFFHSGDAIGYYACMAYFPDRATTICWAVNGNYGKIDEFTSTKTAMEKIFGTIFE